LSTVFLFFLACSAILKFLSEFIKKQSFRTIQDKIVKKENSLLSIIIFNVGLCLNKKLHIFFIDLKI